MGGAEPDVVVRLAVFYQLNVCSSFRFLEHGIMILFQFAARPCCFPLYVHDLTLDDRVGWHTR
jgi:hypothetical protein